MMFDKQIIYLTLLSLVEILGDFSLEKYSKTWQLKDLTKGSLYYAGNEEYEKIEYLILNIDI